MLVLFRRVLNDFNSQSNYTNLTEHKYLKKHFIKIVPTDCFACVAHQGTQHLKIFRCCHCDKKNTARADKTSSFWAIKNEIEFAIALAVVGGGLTIL